VFKTFSVPKTAGSKLDKAEKLGIAVINEAEFIQLMKDYGQLEA